MMRDACETRLTANVSSAVFVWVRRRRVATGRDGVSVGEPRRKEAIRARREHREDSRTREMKKLTLLNRRSKTGETSVFLVFETR